LLASLRRCRSHWCSMRRRTARDGRAAAALGVSECS
jgi:hypothetical protein